jgi:hypothetical protein
MKVRTTVHKKLGVAQLELSGHLTGQSADATRRVLKAATKAGVQRVIIDVCDLDDVDPHLALALLDYNQRLARDGGWLWLVHGAGNVGSTLRYLGVHDRVRSSPSRAAAGWLGSRTSVGTKDTHEWGTRH